MIMNVTAIYTTVTFTKKTLPEEYPNSRFWGNYLSMQSTIIVDTVTSSMVGGL